MKIVFLNRLKYRFAWWHWYLNDNPDWGNPIYGKTRAQRTETLERLFQRKLQREPKPEDYDL